MIWQMKDKQEGGGGSKHASRCGKKYGGSRSRSKFLCVVPSGRRPGPKTHRLARGGAEEAGRERNKSRQVGGARSDRHESESHPEEITSGRVTASEGEGGGTLKKEVCSWER